MKYYKVTVPVGYEVYKYFRALNQNNAKEIACLDIEDNFSSWLDDGCEFINFYSRAIVEETTKEEFEDGTWIEFDEEDDDYCEDCGPIDTDK
jgi:hypothetical protein